MSGDVHVRICERLGVKLPGATRRLVHRWNRREAQSVREALQARLAESAWNCILRSVLGPHSQKMLCGFTPAVSEPAPNVMLATVRGLNLRRRTEVTWTILLATRWLRGIGYYGQ